LGISAPAIASATAQHPGTRPAPVNHTIARPALPVGQHYACPPARPGQMTCMSIVPAHLWRPASASAIRPALTGAYFPNELRSAYKLAGASANRGKGKTIAIVDAFNNPHAGTDLGKYRRIFHLPPCTKANGCLRIVNQNGKASPLPNARFDWGVEI